MTAKKPKAPVITMIACKSSQVESHGYDPVTQTLAVKFKNGGVYHYHNVPPAMQHDMLKSPSIGSFLHSNVKGKFTHKKLGD